MNQMPYPGPSTLFHIRINALFMLLWVTNLVMITFAVESVMTNGVGAIVLFASEVREDKIYISSVSQVVFSMPFYWQARLTRWQNMYSLPTNSSVRGRAEVKMHLLGKTRAYMSSTLIWSPVWALCDPRNCH